MALSSLKMNKIYYALKNKKCIHRSRIITNSKVFKVYYCQDDCVHFNYNL